MEKTTASHSPLTSESCPPEQAWKHVKSTLDRTTPGWNKSAGTDFDEVVKACSAVVRMSNAEGELHDLQHQLRQEMGTLRVVIGMAEMPERAQKELRAMLIRMARQL